MVHWRHVFFVVAAAVLAAEVSADPETVEGMYLEKRGDDTALKRLKERRHKPGEGDNRVDPMQARPSVPAFRQGHMGSSGGAARAFQGVLGKQNLPKVPKGTVSSWLQQVQQRQRQRQLQQKQGRIPGSKFQPKGQYQAPIARRQESLTYSPPLGTSIKERGLLMSTASPEIISRVDLPSTTTGNFTYSATYVVCFFVLELQPSKVCSIEYKTSF